MVDIDESGNAIVAWYQDDGIAYGLYTRRYDSQSGTWAAVVQLDSGESGDAENPQIAIDGDGNVVVIWERYSVNRTIMGARYDVTTDTWGEIESLCAELSEDAVIHTGIDPSTVHVYAPRLTFDQNGRAVMIWRMSGQDDACIMVSILN